jgi:hypothetical protein
VVTPWRTRTTTERRPAVRHPRDASHRVNARAAGCGSPSKRGTRGGVRSRPAREETACHGLRERS